MPHSCGQVCEREFKPPCGHKCLLLCHPGKLYHCNCLRMVISSYAEAKKLCKLNSKLKFYVKYWKIMPFKVLVKKTLEAAGRGRT